MTTRSEDGPLRVAIVDDHALVRAAIRDGLIGAPDIELVAELASAEEAIVTLPHVRPDVVLVDLDLPGRAGTEVIRELAPRQPNTWFVVLSADQAEASVIDAVRLGARGYLSKDLESPALLRALRGIRRGEAPFGRRPTRILAERFQVLIQRSASANLRMPELTERENEVLRLLAEGLTDRGIAEALVISRRTVETHVGNILAKLQVESRVQAARIYRQRA